MTEIHRPNEQTWLPEPEPFKRVFVFAMGYTQSVERVTGLETLWAAHRALVTAGTWILPPLPWDSDPSTWASFIARHTTPATEIRMVCYSWGGGWLFPRLAQQLQQRNRSIQSAVLVDAVWRSSWYPTWASKLLPVNALSMVGLAKVRIPTNVRHVVPFRQRVNRPAGHELQADGPETRIFPTRWLAAPHEEMDDQRAVHDVALQIARGDLKPV